MYPENHYIAAVYRNDFAVLKHVKTDLDFKHFTEKDEVVSTATKLLEGNELIQGDLIRIWYYCAAEDRKYESGDYYVVADFDDDLHVMSAIDHYNLIFS